MLLQPSLVTDLTRTTRLDATRQPSPTPGQKDKWRRKVAPTLTISDNAPAHHTPELFAVFQDAKIVFV